MKALLILTFAFTHGSENTTTLFDSVAECEAALTAVLEYTENDYLRANLERGSRCIPYEWPVTGG